MSSRQKLIKEKWTRPAKPDRGYKKPHPRSRKRSLRRA